MELTKNHGKGGFTMDACAEGKVCRLGFDGFRVLQLQQGFEGKNYIIGRISHLQDSFPDFCDYSQASKGIGWTEIKARFYDLLHLLP